MKIKSNYTKPINYQFGLALLLLIGLLIFGLYSLGQNSLAVNRIETNIQNSAFNYKGFKSEGLELQINQENFKKIKQKRVEALKKGLLFTSRLDLVPADIRIDDEQYSVSLRLKGDLLDHLRDDKWSYRIELKNENTWKGMSEFSIHNSKARSHISEWYMHQLFSHEGIITPLYDFIQLEENGILKGVYAYEEHFTDELLLRNKRQIAPILKHNDDAYWDNVQKDVKPFYYTKALEIDLFNKNNSGNAEFMESFEFAKSLLHRFLNKEIEASDIFDLNKMAKYYALMELSHAFHAQQITNIRFYLNQSTGKLEPIAFDSFGEVLPAVNADWEAAGEAMNAKVSPRQGYPYGGVYMHLLFQDMDFVREYIKYLNQYTNPTYLDNVKRQLVNAVAVREEFIRQDSEYTEYAFSFEQLFKKAEFTRKKILPLPNYSLKVFTQSDTRKNLALQSFHYFPIEIIGLGNEIELTDQLANPLILEAYNKTTSQKIYSLLNSKEKEYLYYKTLGTDSIFQYKIVKNKLPNKNAEPIQSELSYWIENNVLVQDGNKLTFSNQKTILSQQLIIPKGRILHIKPGQEIEFNDEAALISFSPIISEGSVQDRIRFIGTSQGNQGIISNENSRFAFCDFIQLSEVQYRGIHSPAGLLITDDCSMSNCTFEESNGRYAISLRHSNYTITNTSIANSSGHGLSVFDSKGSGRHVVFETIAGNAVHIDDSTIQLSQVDFNEIEGNAILATNNTEIGIDSIKIQNSFQGLVSHDNGRINCGNAIFTNLQNGIVLTAKDLKESVFEGNEIAFEDVKNKVVQDMHTTVLINGKVLTE